MELFYILTIQSANITKYLTSQVQWLHFITFPIQSFAFIFISHTY